MEAALSSTLPPMLSRQEVAANLSFDRLIPAIEDGFRAFHAGRAPVSPVTSLHMEDVNGETHIRAGYLTDGSVLCVKVANFYFDNPRAGLPTMDCAVIVSDRRTGRVRVIICDGGLLSDMRTAAASAVATRVLARSDANSVGLVGAGNQAYWHGIALGHVRKIGQMKVWSRSSERAAATAKRLAVATGKPVVSASLDEVASCDIVVTATPARSPILDQQRLARGACVIAMGADTPGKRELGSNITRQANWFVADSLKQARRAGELQWLTDLPQSTQVTELGAVIAGEQAPRQNEDALIIFDSTGIAFQDVVAASLLLGEKGK